MKLALTPGIKTALLPLAMTLALTACPQQEQAAAAPATQAATAPEITPITGVSGTYVLDPRHTDVLVQWNHFGFSNPSLHLGQVNGQVVYDADNVAASSVDVSIPFAGLESHVADFNAHLGSADFFDADNFPIAARFKSTAVEAAGINQLKVTGDLTIKDVTRQVVLDVSINGFGEHPMAKRATAGFDATATLLRSDFGLGAYAPHVSDEVKIRITTEAMAPAEG